MKFCGRYRYKNNDGTIIELDSDNKLLDFIVEHGEDLNPTSLDIVYDNTRRDLTLNKLTSLRRVNKNLYLNNTTSDELNLDLESEAPADDNSIGVTKFLSGLRIDGKLLFPEFIPQEYWVRARKRFKELDFSEVEKRTFFEKVNGEYVINEGSIDLDEMQETMTEKWASQAEIGSALHNVMQIFFSRYSDTGSVRNKTDEEIIQIVKDKIKDESHLKYLNDDTIKSLINFGRNIVKRFDPDGRGNVNYFPEFKLSSMSTLTNENGDPYKLVGTIDLLVLDSDGNLHLIDYKTSELDYKDYKSAKEITFEYQMAVYSQLLKLNGISLNNVSIYVVPIKLINLHQDEGNWTVDNVEPMETLQQIDYFNKPYIQDNIEQFLPRVTVVDTTPEKMMETTEVFLTETFGGKYEYGKEANVDKLTDIVNKNAKLNEDTNKWSVDWYGRSESAATKEDLVQRLKSMIESTPRRRMDATIQLKNRLKECIKSRLEGGNDRIDIEARYAEDPNWINNYLSTYLNRTWEVQEGNDITDYHGMIILKNLVTNQVDVLMVSTKDLREEIPLFKGNFITGNFQADIVEQSKKNSLVLDSNEGNIELLKAMVMLNQMPGIFQGGVLGEIKAINTRRGDAITASNEILKYNWNILNKLHPLVKEDNYSNGTIKVSDSYTVFRNSLANIISLYGDNWAQHSRWEEFESSFSALESVPNGNKLLVRQKLLELKEQFEKVFKGISRQKSRDDISNPEVKLYRQLLLAIAETSNTKIPQIYKDGNLWLDHVNILTKGLSGLELDNPGNQTSQALNNATSLIMQVYQNVRETMQRDLPKTTSKTEALKKDKGFGFIKERTLGNATSMYTNMYYMEDGNIYLRNPWEDNDGIKQPLSQEEREFLKFFLLEINKNRRPNDVNNLEEVIKDSKSSFFWLPLSKGGFSSELATNGLFKMLKDKLKNLTPKRAVKHLKDEIEGFLKDDPTEDGADILWEMNTRFDAGEDARERLRIINDRTRDEGIGYFELNLETLLLQHKFAYITKQYMDEIFPDLQAIHASIQAAEFDANSPFKNLSTFYNNFIKSKVLGKNIDSNKYNVTRAYTNMAMRFASSLALGFNPRQLYQGIEGMWKDMSLLIRKPDGTDNFTFSNLRDSFLSTLPELINFKGGRTKWQALNELYAINDMGNNEYVNRIKSDKFGFIGFFDRIMFKFASRPDFYNRATIFGAQMRGDGVWEAHEFKDDGSLVYDWTKDKRFNRFANNDTSDLELYNKQKGLYMAMARQMEIEHTRNQDGSLFTMLDENGNYNALPKAYTIQQIDGYRDLADSIYGYYASERRSLIQAHGLGALFFQMNTYWSAKKNQWLAPGNVKLQGKMVQYTEQAADGSTIRYFLDNNGGFVPEGDPNATDIPYYVWKGDFQEGILLTVVKLFYNNGKFSWHWNEIYNADDANLRRAYRANLGQLFYDLFMFLIMGSLIGSSMQNNAKEYIKKETDPFKRFAADYSANIFTSSFMDFVPWGFVTNVGMDWTPFALDTMTRFRNTWADYIAGDKSLKSSLYSTFGALRTTKQLWE